ncbi:MAG: hypothetical protein HRU70_03710 [Phycisphaeraceae bacterium]|nr:MAG: hypothetical protein HRU70_03710 [Phycisphaeraceae bacterium]
MSPTRTLATRRRIGLDCVWFGLVMMTAALVAGCSEPILTDTESRSQYDRYDQIRAQRAPGYTENVFGRDKPNLRGRLLGRN